MARQLLDKTYQVYFNNINNDNDNSIHPIGSPPPDLFPLLNQSRHVNTTNDIPLSSRQASPADSTSSMEFLAEVSPLRPHYYFHHGNPISLFSLFS